MLTWLLPKRRAPRRGRLPSGSGHGVAEARALLAEIPDWAGPQLAPFSRAQVAAACFLARRFQRRQPGP